MDENTALILRGVQLAKDLEANLAHHNLATQSDYIARTCEDIIRVFSSVRERLSSSHMIREPQRFGGVGGGDGGVLDRMRTGHDQRLDHPRLFHPQMVAPQAFPIQPAAPTVRLRRTGSDGDPPVHHQAPQRPRRPSRRDELHRRTMIVPAPQMGNLDIPPEDGYTWRKYGSKEILGSKYPRAYYRCTHQRLYNCPAKKQVQRLDDNPFMFQVTYRSNHICHMSATAPSVPLPSIDVTVHQPPQPPTSGGGAITSHWLTMDIKPQSGEGSSAASFHDMDVRRDFGHTVSVSSTSNAAAADSGTAGPSTARYDRDVGDYGGQPVVDLVDVIFNYSDPGSSSNNSMDLIFPSTDQKGDISGEKKN